MKLSIGAFVLVLFAASLAKADCYWNGSRYSEGALICASGRNNICRNGSWSDAGACRSEEPQDSAKQNSPLAKKGAAKSVVDLAKLKPATGVTEAEAIATLTVALGKEATADAASGACVYQAGAKTYCAPLSKENCDKLKGAWTEGGTCP